MSELIQWPRAKYWTASWNPVLPNGKFTNKIEEFPVHLQIHQVPWAKKGETK